jgi:hypothetical protein
MIRAFCHALAAFALGASASTSAGERLSLMTDLQAAYKGSLSFETYHMLFFFQSRPRKEFEFQTQLSPTPNFFEVGFWLGPKTKFRLGKIFIPFESRSPHVTYGGRVNTSATAHPGTEAFLPDYWAEYGLGFETTLFEDQDFRLNLDAVLVNGLREGGTDPNATTSLPSYPSFSDSSLLLVPDNNSDKAIGGRVEAKIFDAVTVGAATYRCRYTNEGNLYRSLWIYGADVGINIEGLILRAGYIGMEVGLVSPGTRMLRGGVFAELGGQFGKWRALARTGTYQSDSRVHTPGDQQLVGVSFRYQAHPFFISASYHHDFLVNSAKTVFDYGAIGVGVYL